MALLEEQQQLENSSIDDDVIFNYASKITRQFTLTHTWSKKHSSFLTRKSFIVWHLKTNCVKYANVADCSFCFVSLGLCVQVQVKLPALQEVFWLCWRVCRMLLTWRSTKTWSPGFWRCALTSLWCHTETSSVYSASYNIWNTDLFKLVSSVK